MKRFFAIICLIAFTQTAFSQMAATVKGELLIQLKLNATPADVEKEAFEELGILPALKMKEVVSDYMRIWLFTFNEDEIAKRDMIRVMNSLKSVSVTQANHIVADRVVPNDPFFGQQWHHYQANDHDIDSDLAWNITTGGLTATGDSIVVCVVETGGAKWDVVDIVENHWVNINEIPGNEVDDDSNGYVDDYHGWNSSANNDNVIGSSSHGTQVSSMIGAKGDNGQGISGVNWDVKLMQVRMGGVSESNVIAAYTYPLIMRKLYNQTGGEQGAFVVAVNSSWGTDFGQPADAPLWCAMYDSLGTYGVLSCGATANNNTNVDVQGDLPTACPSDYLISVTSTNSSDVKVSSAGYGLTTIDLAAPGNQVYLANNTAYGNTSGTSFATPCVSGAVALLYSVPCNSLMSLVNQNPALVAFQMKGFILSGIDQTEELQTQTLSGGRLNVNNSLTELLEICGSCVAPIAPFVEQIEGTLNYILHWTAVSEVQSVSVRYRLLGDEEWTFANNLDSDSLLLSNLLACSDYEVQLMSHCSLEESDWTQSISFPTDGCCVHPNGVLISSIEANTAYVIWEPVLAASAYTVILVDENGVDNTYTSILDPVLFLNQLDSCMQYSVSVYSNCIGEIPPPVPVTFQTPGCGVCTDLTYCAASGTANTEYIRRVIVGDIDHESVVGEGYTFVAEQTTDLVIGQTYPIQCYPGFPGQAYNQNFRVWIDCNNDGIFQSPEERLFDAAEPTQTLAEGTITIPESATPGYVRMRVAMRYAQFSSTEPPVCGEWDYGEVEDYCVTLTTSILVAEENQNYRINIFPNPADDKLYVDLKNHSHNSFIHIYDVQGNLVKSEMLNANQVIDVATLPAGLYNVIMVSDKVLVNNRFVKK